MPLGAVQVTFRDKTMKIFRPFGGARVATATLAGLLILIVGSTAPAAPRPAQTLTSSAQSQDNPGATPGAPPARQQPPDLTPTPGLNPTPLTPKQQRDLLKFNYIKMKKEADELAELAKSLQTELDKSNENVLSLSVVQKADKIEKLAKKIKTGALD